MAQKILLLSLSGKYGTIIGKIVAEKLGRGFLNIDDQIVKMLSKLQPVPAKHGKNLFDEYEKRVIQEALKSEYEIIYASYGLFIHNRQFFQNCRRIYVRLEKSDLKKFADDDLIVNHLAFVDRDNILCQNGLKVQADALLPEKTACEIIEIIRTKI